MHARIEMHADPDLDECVDAVEGRNVKAKTVTKPPDKDLTNSDSANRRPSRRATVQGGRGPLKSSLKSSLRSSNASIASDPSPSMRRNVSFSSLEIRSYGITLGDTPTLKGPPISLDWSNHKATHVHDIDTYEQLRSITADNPTPLNPRRKTDELFIQPSLRQDLLMHDAGFSRTQVRIATEEAQHAFIKRHKGAKRSVRLDEMMEKVKSRFSCVSAED